MMVPFFLAIVCPHILESLFFYIKSYRKRYDFQIIFITFARRYHSAHAELRLFSLFIGGGFAETRSWEGVGVVTYKAFT